MVPAAATADTPAAHAFTDAQRQALLELPFLVLTGPTACGKSALALALAQALRPYGAVEIVSMDSALVYRGMDIGTAKPSAAEQARVPHHLIDVREPQQSYSAAEFVGDCLRLIPAILARGALPLLVGGTLLYLHALLHGLDPLPAADAAVRARIDADARAHGWPAMHARLAQVDPATAARLAPHDAQRIQRALEVWMLSGQPLSQLQTRAQTNPEREAAQQAWVAERVLSLEPASRAWLHARTDARLHAMVQAGFLQEVLRLRALPQLHAQLPSIRSVGYRQAWLMLDAALDAVDAATDMDAVLTDAKAPDAPWLQQAQAATRQLAKRQITWLRSMPTRQVLHCDVLTAEQMLERALQQALLQVRRISEV